MKSPKTSSPTLPATALDPEARENDGGVGCAPARRRQEVAGREELSRAWESLEGRHEQVRHDDPGAEDGRRAAG